MRLDYIRFNLIVYKMLQCGTEQGNAVGIYPQVPSSLSNTNVQYRVYIYIYMFLYIYIVKINR